MKINICKIGILGGTFDPIHLGHLIIAEEIRIKFGLNKILFVPSGNPPHKKSLDITSAFHRLNMVNIATSSNKYFGVSDIEINRKGYSYTIDTLKELKNIYSNFTEFYYIIGSDVLLDLKSWKDFDQVISSCEFIVTMRKEQSKEDILKQILVLKTDYLAKINFAFDMPLIEISSTDLRSRIKKHSTIKYLVLDEVEQYIINNNLY